MWVARYFQITLSVSTDTWAIDFIIGQTIVGGICYQEEVLGNIIDRKAADNIPVPRHFKQGWSVLERDLSGIKRGIDNRVFLGSWWWNFQITPIVNAIIN